ncbi:MAG: dihydrolipoyl dehydrogenase [Rikenellaceae bacterium]
MYDIIFIGSGPGGYAGAVRASQLGAKVAVIEKAELGGVCLNWGCIPTKALLKSAQVYKYAKSAAEFGVCVEGVSADIAKMVERSRGVASQMNKGVEFLMKKNGVQVITGVGKIVEKGRVEVDGTIYEARNIIVATGARPRCVDAIPVDGVRVLNSRGALLNDKIPQSLIVVGSGAIGLEFASFYSALGTKVTVVEFLDRVAPLEDAEISSTLERYLRKNKITVMTSTAVQSVESTEDGCKVVVNGKKGEVTLECDMVLSAVGVSANVEGIGLEECGIELERGKIKVDLDTYSTNVEGVYAIGDVIATPALAHVATAEAIACVEGIMGHKKESVNYGAVPSCVYTFCEVASVGMTQSEAEAVGEIMVGKFSMMASGKGAAAGMRDGLVKLVFSKESGVLLGAHLAGLNVTEMIAGLTYMVKNKVTAQDIISTIHPHPTIAESVMEAAAAALGEAIHG